MGTTQTDRIEKRILLRAPRSRVWRALADAEEFGRWFGVELAGDFTAGKTLRGKVTTKGWEHITFEVFVEKVDPERLISWRWHPAPVEPEKMDYSKEPTTLVVFQLEEVSGGTMLTVVESGFDRLSPERRAQAFRLNEDGWTQQMTNVERHVAKAS
jgi:uncharacterized protein YndB with AHSA1/START domain